MTSAAIRFYVGAILIWGLSACGSLPDSQVVSGSLFSSPKGNSHLIVGLSSRNLNRLSLIWGASVSYQLRFVKFDPVTGLTNKNKPDAADYGKATLGESGTDHLRAFNFVTISLESGQYALDRVTLAGHDRVLHVATFTTDHQATEFTPKFKLQPGDVLYIGNFLVEGIDDSESTNGRLKYKYALRYDGLTTGGQQYARAQRLNLTRFRAEELSLPKDRRILFGGSR